MSTQDTPQGTIERSNEFPPGIPFIVGNEGAERFSYYGMRSILYIYLGYLFTQVMSTTQIEAGEARAQATAIAHLFMAGVYAFPMIGAILADRLAGKYPVILTVSVIYCAGHAVLAVAGRFDAWGNQETAIWLMYTGLSLIAIGSGGIKPCVSANVGDQFTAKNSHLVTMVFQVFYFIINFGSFFSTILTPILYQRYGAEVAFGVPGIFMAIATLVFWFGRHRFVHVPPNPGGRLGLKDFAASVLLFSPIIALIMAVFVVGHDFQTPALDGRTKLAFYGVYISQYLFFLAQNSWHYFLIAFGLCGIGLLIFAQRQKEKPDNGFIAVTLAAWQARKSRRPGIGFFENVRGQYGEAAEGPPAVLRIMLVFSMVSVFWSLFDQHASTWIEQAKQMSRVITVPHYLGIVGAGATLALSLFGGVWLFSWISNSPIPKRVTQGFFALIGVAIAGAGLYDLVTGDTMTIELQAAQISALNPLMVMMIIPALNAWVYQPMIRRGREIPPLLKMTVGMFMAAAAFAAAALIQERIEAHGPGQVHVLWQVIQYFIMTTAEVLVSVTGLEFAYTQAPRSMKSTIMGFWLLCVTGGNVLVAFLAPMETILSLSQFFWFFTGVMCCAAVLFAIMARFYKGKSYLQTAASH